MAISFGDHDLLKYDAQYSVLICQRCKYAVQKNATESHLLRHKIYRQDRQQLLSSISQLRLAEPDDVQFPSVESPPVEGLPVISGYRCTATGCDSLCASMKRMRRHWSESHGSSNLPKSFAWPANLQTFFRGTKMRYFEVARPRSVAEEMSGACAESTNQQRELGPQQATVPHESTIALQENRKLELDLESLRYFHHFSMVTSLMLPTTYGSSNYWQTEVVAQTLKLSWLMFGLLSISASHLASLSDDETAKRIHLERSAHFWRGFLAGWGELKHDLGMNEVVETKMGAQMICIHRCCRLDELPCSMQSFALNARGCTDPGFALQSVVSGDGFFETFDRVKPNLKCSDSSSSTGIASPMILQRICALPSRMLEVFGKPDNALDVLATLSAIDALIGCCLLSYEADDMETVWIGMESWLKMLSNHFIRLFLHKSPAALIVFGHWLLLVERAERYCWFLKGTAAILLQQIQTDLPQDSAVRRLLNG